MIETLLGTLFGGAFRLAPEVLKWLDRKNERAHELSMFDKQLDADKLKASQALQMAETQNEGALSLAEVNALVEATKAQATPSGVPFIDGLNASVRPVVTYWWVIVLYTAALIAQFILLKAQGTSTVESILKLWGTEEKTIVASLLSFWFVDRSLRNNGLR